MGASDINVWVAIIAAYAAIVATAALALEVRRWAEARARLVLNVSPDMVYAHDQNGSYLVADVVNRGRLPTTITLFRLDVYDNWWKALLRKRTGHSGIITNPSPAGGPTNLPSVLAPGEQWTGVANQTDDLMEWAKMKRVYVVIYASHRNKSYIRRILTLLRG